MNSQLSVWILPCGFCRERGGTAGTVPVFITGTDVENSPISVSGGNVGIGTTALNGIAGAHPSQTTFYG